MPEISRFFGIIIRTQRQQRLVEAWAELHQAELLAAWINLQAGRKPEPIDPLK
jgi:hypothetical protein